MTLGNPFGGFGSSLSPLTAQQMNLLNQLRNQQLLGLARQMSNPLTNQNAFMHPQLLGGFVQGLEDRVKVSNLPLTTQFGELVGWRAWKFKEGHLISPYVETIWFPKEVHKARLNRLNEEPTTSPFEHPGGFFSHKEFDQVLEQESGWTVIGRIDMWGDVVEHENGYRSEFARIKSLDYFAPELPKSFMDWLIAEYMG